MSSNKPKIALFVGSDLVAHREMCPVVEHMVNNGFEPVLFYPKHHASNNPDASQQIFKDYVYVERLILHDTVYPYLEANPAADPKYMTPEQVCKKYGLQPPVAVENINDPAFFQNINGYEDLIGTFSLRCTQMFRPDVTQHLKADGRFLLNLHSGVLPEFRGLYATPRAIFEKIANPGSVGEFGCTLHHVDPFTGGKGDASKRYAGIDTGNIVTLKSRRITKDKSVYATNIDLSDMGANAVIETVNSLVRGDSLRGYVQNNEQGRYYTYATPAEVKEWQDHDLTMFDRAEVTSILVSTFSKPGTEHAAGLASAIETALDTRFGPATPNTTPAAAIGSAHGNGHDTGEAFKKVADRKPQPAGNGNGYGAGTNNGGAAGSPASTTPVRRVIGAHSVPACRPAG